MKRLAGLFSIAMLVSILAAPALAAPQHPGPPLGWTAHPPIHVRPGVSNRAPSGYSPAQIRQAYGFDELTQNGAGQTIAIVDAYDDPTIFNDLQVFKDTYGITGCSLTKVNQTGGSKLPRANSGWALEISLDVEWACAIAPGANILLVEASSNSFTNLLHAVDYAAAHARVVSMSWGGSEFSSESNFDSSFAVNGVSFTASSGDSGSGTLYPAASPNVIAVGGTTLTLDSGGNATETAWSGSGGGISAYEPRPGFQTGFLSNTNRGIPDVSYDADPNTGFPVYDTTRYLGQTGWFEVGGTSAGAPQWAALIALVNQSRGASLAGTAAPLYSAYNSSNYRDITSGSNGTWQATTGYDLVTGLGSPLAAALVPYLINH